MGIRRNGMTDEEIRKYMNDQPTIEGIVKEMKTWWSDEGSDTILQECFDKIIELSRKKNKRNKALMLLLNWAEECDFGYDNFPEEYERYEKDIEDMDYIEGMIYIAEKVLEEEADFYEAVYKLGETE